MTVLEYLNKGIVFDMLIDEQKELIDEHNYITEQLKELNDASAAALMAENEMAKQECINKVLQFEKDKHDFLRVLSDIENVDDRMMIKYKFYDGLSYYQIARKMGVSKPTVIKHIRDTISEMKLPGWLIV